MRFTVLGSSGFIGRHLVHHLHADGHDVAEPPRSMGSLVGEDLGHVIYAIGMTGNHRQFPEKAQEAHVDVLRRLMQGARFDSWLYLSSTRMYGHLPEGTLASEDVTIPLPADADAFDRSKMEGEALCLDEANETVRIVRLSNVYGADQSEHTFLGSILKDLKRTGAVTIGESPQSSKDYVAIHDVVALLPRIAAEGRERIYNVASGTITTHEQIAKAATAQGLRVDFAPNGPTRTFPQIDNRRALSEFGWKPRRLTDDLPALLAGLR